MCVIGLGCGQVVAGPVSDTIGRRKPLLAGLIVFIAASLGCALAPSLLVLDLMRLVQGLAGATGIVMARAMTRDLYMGVEAARFFATLGAVVAVAPIFAPLLGAQVLVFVQWRGVFLVVTAIGVALLMAAGLGTAETLPARLRHEGGLRAAMETYASLVVRRRYMAYALPGSLAAATLFAYISASSFVYQGIFGFGPQLYGLLFGINGCGLLLANVVNVRLVRSVPVERVFTFGLWTVACAGVLLVVAAVTRAGPWAMLPLLFVSVSSIGFIISNGVALALADEGSRAGSAAALLGLLQFTAAAVAAPLVGLAGVSAVPMGVVIAGAATSAILVYLVLRPAESQEPAAAGSPA
jgi:MFS transporter, DHA1 family, multidrug resistance protein